MAEDSRKITGEIAISQKVIDETKSTTKNISGFKEKILESLYKPVTELFEIILVGTISLESSDIHIEPQEKDAKIRIRIDGILQEVLSVDRNIYGALLSRIKLLSGLKLNIEDKPQDGRFSIVFGENPVEIRTSTLPAEYGEAIVLRILNPKNLLDLENLGLRKDLLETFIKEILKPNGMIIITGPTGAGKTTTLYAILRRVNKPEIKTITIEDPIEYHLAGVSQTQVNQKKGYTFADGLKSIMRQDPDVILVGEIRDLETADIALQAALTGHLVLTTLHTNDAAGTISRLISLGAKAVNIAPAINMVMAQRLVRRVCKECAVMEKISPEGLKRFRSALANVPEKIEIPEINERTTIPTARGCKACNFTGYRGRIGILEVFLNDDDLQKLVLKSPPIVEVKELAVKKGMVTMYQDGLIKVLEKTTTLDEVTRVTGD